MEIGDAQQCCSWEEPIAIPILYLLRWIVIVVDDDDDISGHVIIHLDDLPYHQL